MSSSAESYQVTTSTTQMGDRVTTTSTAIGRITAIGGESISIGGLRCSLGAGSPDVTAFKVGDRVDARCLNGTLTTLAAHS